MEKVGIVGCGSISHTHGWCLNQIDNVKIVAVADIIPERAEDFSRRFTAGTASVFSDYKEMFEKTDLDVIHICTPHDMHTPIAEDAMRCGISVFCEKPPAISLEEFEHLKTISEKNNVRIGFCFQNRYNKTIQKADALVQNGLLGAVVGARAFVTWRRDEDYYNTPWKGMLATSGGGALINQSIHTLDLLLRYFDEPTSVKASLSNHHLPCSVEVEDTVEAWMEFPGGKRACFYASTAYERDAPVMMEFQCEKGSITIIDNVLTIRYEDGRRENHICEEPTGIGKSYWGSGHLSCIRDFYSTKDAGIPYQNDWNGVRNTMNTMMKIYDFRENQK